MEKEKKKVFPLVLGAFLVVLLGVFTAWLISSKSGGLKDDAAAGVVATSKEAGKLDPNIKYDTATGTLREGGINGEGTHRLEREGGASKNVYLTSSMVNLDNFVGKEVNIWGETIASKKAGWLMDVAKIQLAE